MAILPEEMVVKDVERYLDQEGIWYFKTKGSAYGKSGLPDIIAVVEGVFTGFEIKRSKGGKPSPLQIYHRQQIIESGGACEFVDDVSVAKDVVGLIRRGEYNAL